MKTGIVNVKRKIERARAGEYEGSERAREKERHARAVAAHAFHDGSVRGRVGFQLQRAELDPKQLVAEPSVPKQHVTVAHLALAAAAAAASGAAVLVGAF